MLSQRAGGNSPADAFSLTTSLTNTVNYAWHTFYGSGPSEDQGFAVAIDASDNIYIAGSSANWVGDNGALPLHECGGGYDILVMKLNAAGQHQWHTCYGSLEDDAAYAIAIDDSGYVYVAGTSSAAWWDGDSPIHPYSGDKDITVLKLNSNGAYQWHTFYGSPGVENGFGMAVGRNGEVYISGSSTAAWQGDNDANPLHPFSGSSALTVLKLNANGQYQWHTFYGSAGGDDSGALALDKNGGVYITVSSFAPWLGDNSANPLHPYSGGRDLAVLKLNASGQYQWHTFYGSVENDLATDLAIDANGGVYIAGVSYDEWMGDGGASALHSYGFGGRAVLKLNAAGQYQWHTFYLSARTHRGNSLAVDGNGGVYISGVSDDIWLGDGDTPPLHSYPGETGSALTAIKLNAAGQYQWHTFYGPLFNLDYDGSALALDNNGNVYLATNSYFTWLGDNDTLPLHPHSQPPDSIYTDSDLVIVKLSNAGGYGWHTFYGSTDSGECGTSAVVDTSGNVYIAGSSYTSWQGEGNTPPLHPYTGNGDLFVLKLNAAGQYQWHTFYGPSNWVTSIAVDEDGNVYIAGGSGVSWQGDGGANPLHAHSGGNDLVVLKLDSNGAYQWHTFQGLSDTDYKPAITIGGNGSIYVAGNSSASWLGDGSIDPLHAYSGAQDLFVLKLNNSGAYQWHTFYGSTEPDLSQAIASDINGNIYVTGDSNMSWQGDNNGNPLHPYNGGLSDLFVLKLSNTGAYQWHTFYGSISNTETGKAIAVERNGPGVYIAGNSWAAWEGDNNTPPLHPYSNGGLTVLKLDSNGAYQWHTFYSSNHSPNYQDSANGINVDNHGGVYVTGDSSASWQGDGGTDPLHAYSDADIVVLKLNAAGQYQWHTFYGGLNGYDRAAAVAVDGSGGIYVAGYSDFSWQGDNGINPLHRYSGDIDIFALKLQPSTAIRLAVSANPALVGQVLTFTIAMTPTLGIPTGVVTLTIDGGPGILLALDSKGKATYVTSSLSPGRHTIQAQYASDTNYLSSTAYLQLNVLWKILMAVLYKR